ncbi:hypothetical protein CDD80_3965 [Ophiocordyceps camponoti-rufipedis]|uniref:CAP-Gly domain-containing protein n=1 Tax=Ophiocordyceps camponoti-rufipedis TaxID=2004952 RepID=A0A2C5ZIZ5_9HYPO|nr:hypothetical protein CDD80_3965 [Ophiocordyceps camponoti-rufipedis]
MAPTATATTTTSATSAFHSSSRSVLSRAHRRPANSASTPDLASVYVAQSRLVPLGLARKASLVALTPSSLASIPDVSESYALDSVLSDSAYDMAPLSPSRGADDVAVGDAVDVPGGMHGTVRFVGTVQGKKGSFAGVELHADFAARGKNNGDVDGVSYFTTTTPGAGIFVPLAKVARRRVTALISPMTPTARFPAAPRNGNGPKSITPPTPALPKFSASVGPGARAPSPQLKRPRASLPRPDSPSRRLQMTPGPRPSLGAPAKITSRYGSPTNKFAQSVRGDPSKKSSKLDTSKSATGPRSASALGNRLHYDDETASVGRFQRPKNNGSVGSTSSANTNKMNYRPASRADNDEELERLRSQIADRDLQLKEQGTTLADMESSLVELQSLIGDPDLAQPRGNGVDDKDSAQLRVMLREKNEKIAMLTAEFDAHRADFRSTIDTLELASAETERVYERRIEEMMTEVRELESRNLDMDSVASQLKGLEELVQELEEGLEDARRGEAEARGEAEFLRGDVERTRSELRREREKTLAGRNQAGDVPNASKELEQKEDEIRGLKAIIHSLSRDSVPPGQRPASLMNSAEDPVQAKIARDNLERRVAELQALLERKSKREEELELELETLRGGPQALAAAPLVTRSTRRDSRDTVIPHGSRSPDASHRRGQALDTMHESDTYSSATETSTLWCEICETNGHDILTCSNVFGSDRGDVSSSRAAALRALAPGDAQPAPLSPSKPKAAAVSTTVSAPGRNVKILPNPMEVGPVAGKESGIVDVEKWCAVCERDGHDSVDCPFEDAL